MVMSRALMAAGGAFTLNIAASVANPDLRALATAAGWTTGRKLIVNITAPLINTLDTGTTPFVAGLRLNFLNAATRVGGLMGGGAAFKSRVPVEVSAVSGVTFSGGGGSGGAGQGVYVRYNTDTTSVNGTGGAGGVGQGFTGISSLTIQAAQSGYPGTSATYPYEVIGGHTKPWAAGGDGGSGGNWGTAGFAGASGTYGGTYSAQGQLTPAGAAGAAGLAVDGNSLVTWLSLPTFQGARAN